MPRTILITGASSGIGEAVARRFATESVNLIIAARRHDRLVALASQLQCPVHFMPIDDRDRHSVALGREKMPRDFSSIDVLVNCAGLALGLEPAHAAALEDWENMIDANVKGLVYMTRAVLPGMVERD